MKAEKAAFFEPVNRWRGENRVPGIAEILLRVPHRGIGEEGNYTYWVIYSTLRVGRHRFRGVAAGISQGCPDEKSPPRFAVRNIFDKLHIGIVFRRVSGCSCGFYTLENPHPPPCFFMVFFACENGMAIAMAD